MVVEYDNSGVSQRPTDSAISMAYNCNYIVSSDLPRSIQSANLLGVDEIHLSNPLFREVDLPVSYGHRQRCLPAFGSGFFDYSGLWDIVLQANRSLMPNYVPLKGCNI